MPEFSQEQLVAWTGGRWVGPPVAVRGIGHDTRALEPGAAYLALRGERHDGHAFVDEAFARGARLAVVDGRGAPRRPRGPLLVVGDTLRALDGLARGHRAQCRGLVIAVTGSVGKTTVKDMIAQVLSAAGPVGASRGNWNNRIGVPLSLLRLEPEDRFGVFEAGMNHPGELAPLVDLLRPDWGVLTRVAPVHMEFFDSEEAVAREKAALLRGLDRAGTAVLGADEPWYDLLRGEAGCRVVTVAMSGEASYLGEHPAGTRVLRVRGPAGDVFDYAVPLPGDPARRNALRAVAVGREAGLAPEAIAEALARFRPPPMRWEETRAGGLLWVNDAYNASPVSMRAALDTFAETEVSGRRWIVLGGMHELGARADEEHRLLGRFAAAGPWAGLLAVGPLGERIAEGAAGAGWGADRCERCATPAEAAAALARRARPGDAVLLKGSRLERIETVLTEWKGLRDAGRGPAGRRRGSGGRCCIT